MLKLFFHSYLHFTVTKIPDYSQIGGHSGYFFYLFIFIYLYCFVYEVKLSASADIASICHIRLVSNPSLINAELTQLKICV